MIRLTRPDCPNPAALASNNYREATNKAALRGASHGKCMYCEANVEANSYCDIEHFKPKAHYPELEYEWGNLGYSCERCNRNYKRDKFDDNLIDPYAEDPEEHLAFYGTFYNGIQNSQKAEVTIDIVNLNRTELQAKRVDRLDLIMKNVRLYKNMPEGAQKEALKEQLLEEAQPDKEFSLMIKCYLKYEGIE